MPLFIYVLFADCIRIHRIIFKIPLGKTPQRILLGPLLKVILVGIQSLALRTQVTLFIELLKSYEQMWLKSGEKNLHGKKVHF